MKQLPPKINVNSAELALAIGSYAKEQGYSIDGNFTTNNLLLYPKSCIWILGGRLSWGNAFHEPDVLTVSSLEEFLTLPEPQPPVRVGEYTCDFRENGVQVGCTFVPWTIVEDIAARNPNLKKS